MENIQGIGLDMISVVAQNLAPSLDTYLSKEIINNYNQHIEKVINNRTQELEEAKKYGGTGLGLVITRQLCEILGGNIIVRSEIDKGSTFTVNLPIKSPDIVMTPTKSLLV